MNATYHVYLIPVLNVIVCMVTVHTVRTVTGETTVPNDVTAVSVVVLPMEPVRLYVIRN